MAKVNSNTICAICHQSINDEAFISFDDILVKMTVYSMLFCSTVHCDCLDNWDMKRSFVAYYNLAMRHKSKLLIDDTGHVYLEENNNPQ